MMIAEALIFLMEDSTGLWERKFVGNDVKTAEEVIDDVSASPVDLANRALGYVTKGLFTWWSERWQHWLRCIRGETTYVPARFRRSD